MGIDCMAICRRRRRGGGRTGEREGEVQNRTVKIWDCGIRNRARNRKGSAAGIEAHHGRAAVRSRLRELPAMAGRNTAGAARVAGGLFGFESRVALWAGGNGRADSGKNRGIREGWRGSGVAAVQPAVGRDGSVLEGRDFFRQRRIGAGGKLISAFGRALEFWRRGAESNRR